MKRIMVRTPTKKWLSNLISLTSVLVMIGTYGVLSHKQHKSNPDDTTMPGLTQMKVGLTKIFEVNKRSKERWIVVDSIASLERLGAGMGIAIVGALILGTLMGCFTKAEAFFLPPLTLVALVPPTAALAIYFVVFDTGMTLYIAMIALGVGAVMARSIYLAIKDVPDEQIAKSYTLGASTPEVISEIILPQLFPRIIDFIRLAIPAALIFLIAAEMVCGDVGIGYRIRLQSRLLNMNVVYPYLLLLATFGYVMDKGLLFTQRLCCSWYEDRGK